MDSPNPEQQAPLSKRKRSPGLPENEGRALSGGLGMSSNARDVTQINYLVRAQSERLRLIDGDGETFSDVLGLIDDYHGVLKRHESLAANLGAKLTGPLLLKSFEKLFDGPIKIIQSPQAFDLVLTPSIAWLDVVTFAHTNPNEFILTDRDGHPGTKTCRFWIKGVQVEISEDDYRLIQSGAPERMIPTVPIPQDEALETATLNILEMRLAILIKRADAVASKARQLNYHLQGRKRAILLRGKVESGGMGTDGPPPQPFSAINARSPGHAPEISKIQQQLLEQFLTSPPLPPNSISTHPKHSRPRPISLHDPPFNPLDNNPVNNNPTQNDTPNIRASQAPTAISDDGQEDRYRILMASKIEKLKKGEVVHPPCDRCRRLKFECTKHLTACQACTKKHAKCCWRDVREGEVGVLEGIFGNGKGIVGVLGGGGKGGVGREDSLNVRRGEMEGISGGSDEMFERADEMMGGVELRQGNENGNRNRVTRGHDGLVVREHGHVPSPSQVHRGGMNQAKDDNDQAILTQIASAASAAAASGGR